MKVAAVQPGQLVDRAGQERRPPPRSPAPTSPPPKPYQTPLYRNGRRAKPSVAPTSFMTSISARRFKISRRMVLPTTSTTPMPKQRAGQPDDPPQDVEHRVQTLDPFGVDLHALHIRQAAMLLAALPCPAACWRRAPASRSACRAGIVGRARRARCRIRTSPRNSANASSAVMTRTAATSQRAAQLLRQGLRPRAAPPSCRGRP